jgi:hypothetical protein
MPRLLRRRDGGSRCEAGGNDHAEAWQAQRRPHGDAVPDEDRGRRNHGSGAGRGRPLYCLFTTTARRIRWTGRAFYEGAAPAEIDLPGAAQGQWKLET